MKLRLLHIALLSMLVLHAQAYQVEVPDKSKRAPQQPLFKSAGTPRYAVLNINNLHTWHRSDGQSNHSPASDNGTYYPRFTSWVIYQDGLMYGGKAYVDAGLTQEAPYNQLIRVGGAHYSTGTVEGRVVGTGASAVATDPSGPDARIFRIRRDYFTLINPETGYYTEELRRDAAEVNEIPITEVTDGLMDAVYTQYRTDWNEWPVEYGAPFIDRNGNGVYDPPPAFTIGHPDDYTDDFTVDSLIKGRYDEPGVAGPDDTAPADQVIWTVYNDLDRQVTTGLAGRSEPLGLEIQKTVWGYKRTDALGNMYFQRWKVINKGGVDIDEMGTKGAFYIDSLYIAQWSDPDVGNAGDDVVGCKPELNLGYAYNAPAIDPEYQKYNLPPPAVGYYYLQGPIVASAGDSAVFDFKRRFDVKNLPLQSLATLYPCPNCSQYTDIPYIEMTPLYWWNHLQGYMFSQYQTPFLDHNGNPTKFPFSGDPIARTGHIDGLGTDYSPPPGDRRILLSSGPVTLAPGDTQEVVVALVVGLGADNFSSIGAMKLIGKHAERAHRSLFSVPRPPAIPTVTAIELDEQIILEWGSDIQRVEETENTVIAGEYVFEGYNVYELPSANAHISGGKKIATFDVKNGVTNIVEDQFDLETGLVVPKVVQKGSDNGVQRYHRITHSQFYSSGFNPEPLRNGREYYFAVTAYSYTHIPESQPKTFESTPMILKVKPQIPFGVQYQAEFGDTLAVTHAAGPGTASIYPIVVNPAAGTGDTYEVRTDTANGMVVWSLRNASTNSLILENQTNISGEENYHTVEGGILLKVIDVATSPKIAGTQVQPKQTNILAPGDIFTYVSPPPQTGPAIQQESARRVGVFPNPYYADASNDVSTQRRIVTFTNLPERAIIRIYNLAGQLVRMLEKNNMSQFLEWDLTNEHNWQVASGMYICHVEMPDIRESKILKLAVIQPQIIPGR